MDLEFVEAMDEGFYLASRKFWKIIWRLRKGKQSLTHCAELGGRTTDPDWVCHGGNTEPGSHVSHGGGKVCRLGGR